MAHAREKDDEYATTQNPRSALYANAEDNPTKERACVRLSGLADSRDPDQFPASWRE